MNILKKALAVVFIVITASATVTICAKNSQGAADDALFGFVLKASARRTITLGETR